MTQHADYLLISDHIFTSKSDEPISGFVAISGDKILEVGYKSQAEKWKQNNTVIYDLGERLITPGFVDNHTFFSGNILTGIGADMSEANSMDEALEILEQYSHSIPKDATLYGHCWDPSMWANSNPGSEPLDALFPNRAVIIFTYERNKCWLNTYAKKQYGFDGTKLNFEAMWKIIKDYLRNKEFVKEEFKEFMKMLNARGVTSVQDVGFDDFYGVLPVLAEMASDHQLTLRENFVFQPVGKPINFEFADMVRKKYNSDFLRFQGFNVMVDRGISSFDADLIEPYSNNPGLHIAHPVDYEAMEKEVLTGDRLGFRFALNAQGDMAVRKSVNIFEKCITVNGKRDARHNMADLELSDPADILTWANLEYRRWFIRRSSLGMVKVSKMLHINLSAQIELKIIGIIEKWLIPA